MPRYLLAYHGGHVDESLEGRKRVMEQFGKWFAELGPTSCPKFTTWDTASSSAQLDLPAATH